MDAVTGRFGPRRWKKGPCEIHSTDLSTKPNGMIIPLRSSSQLEAEPIPFPPLPGLPGGRGLLFGIAQSHRVQPQRELWARRPLDPGLWAPPLVSGERQVPRVPPRRSHVAAQRSHVAVLGCVLFGWDAEACEAERSLRVFVILGDLGSWVNGCWSCSLYLFVSS